MKKLFIIMITILAPFCIHAENASTTTVEEMSFTNDVIELKKIDITLSELTSFPYVITVNIPSETVLNVSGPCHPTVNWYISGSLLTINLMSKDFMDLDPGMTGYIEIYTIEGNCYTIKIECQ